MGLYNIIKEFKDRIAADIAYGERRNAEVDLDVLNRARAQGAITQSTYDEQYAKKSKDWNESNQKLSERTLPLIDRAVAEGWSPADSVTPNTFLTPEAKQMMRPYELAAAEAGFAPPKVEAVSPEESLALKAQIEAQQAADEAAATGRPGKIQQPKQEITQVVNRPMTLREQFDSLPTEGDKYEFKRQLEEKELQRRYQNQLQRLSNQFGAGSEEFKRQWEVMKPLIDQAVQPRKKIEETPAFQNVSKATDGRYAQAGQIMLGIRNQIETAKKIKDPNEKAIYLATTIPKSLQYLGSMASDAINKEEAIRLLPELHSYLSAIFSSQELAGLASARGLDGLKKNPDEYIKKVSMMTNDFIKAHNEVTNSFYNKLGKRGIDQTNAFKIEPIEMSGGERPQDMRSYISNMPVRGTSGIMPMYSGQGTAPQLTQPLPQNVTGRPRQGYFLYQPAQPKVQAP